MAEGSFFFYDLETSGIRPANARIMQFAGQRTNMNLEPIGEPVNLLIKLAPDVLPEPEAILLTGITPQQTLQDGLTESEFLQEFYDQVVQPGTIFMGFNSIRFDDEFMRYLHYRNFYDPYEWQWQNGCSRWDLLDVVRMTRALRPDGIEWPFTSDGKPANRLEMLTKANGLLHDAAHDALSDVHATIAVAKLIKDKQPDLFNYLQNNRNKQAVAKLVNAGQPFIYTSGRYPSATGHTTAVVKLVDHPQKDSALVYDLRHDPTPFLQMSPAELADAWRYKKDRTAEDVSLPVKVIKFNRCPTVAPLGVLKGAEERLQLSVAQIEQNLKLLKAGQAALTTNILKAIEILDAERGAAPQDVDQQLYDGFLSDTDKLASRAVRAAEAKDLPQFTDKLHDQRLQKLLPRYQARNYPASLSGEQREVWENHIKETLLGGGPNSRLAQYFAKLQKLASQNLTSQQEYILTELQLYGESITPEL